jgi:hypothetical protein
LSDAKITGFGPEQAGLKFAATLNEIGVPYQGPESRKPLDPALQVPAMASLKLRASGVWRNFLSLFGGFFDESVLCR